MADVRPFKGVRPKSDLVEKVASPPYDVMNSEEARQMAQGNPLSFLRVVKAEIDLPPEADVHGEEVYRKSSENLQNLIREGAMVRDVAESYYVYEQIMDGHVQTGIMLGASVQEYEDGKIKKHEFTRRVKEDDRARHVEILNANTGPVMLTYRASDAIDGVVNRIRETEATYDFVAKDGVRHRMWAVADTADVSAITEGFQSVNALYVADGHHRSAAAFRVRNIKRDQNSNHTGDELYNHFLAVVFPDDQLQIMGYYRAVKDLNGLTKEDFLEKVVEKFDVEPGGNPEPAGMKQFTMYLDGQWYQMTAKAGTYPENDPVNSLDAAILQNNLLHPVLGIEDPRTDERIDFIGGIRGPKELERRCANDMTVAFALYPTSVGQLMAIADADSVMPPKSTWFEPKLRSGMVVRFLDEE